MLTYLQWVIAVIIAVLCLPALLEGASDGCACSKVVACNTTTTLNPAPTSSPVVVAIPSSNPNPSPTPTPTPTLPTDDPEDCPCSYDAGDCIIKLYDNAGLMGRELLVRGENANLANNDFSDRVESVNVLGTCAWILYRGLNFGDIDRIVVPGVVNRLVPDDRLESLRAVPPAGTIAIALFTETNFEGRMEIICSNVQDLATLELRRVGSAITVQQEGTWIFYSMPNMDGEIARFGPRRLLPGFNEDVGSIAFEE